MSEQQQIGILLISTLKYKQFVQPLLNQIDEFFLPGYEKTIFLFTDELQELTSKSKVVQTLIHPYKYPEVTLLRFSFFNQENDKLKEMDYLFYMDADVAIVNTVWKEILNPLTVVHHCGFYRNGGWGSPNVDTNSTAYFDEEYRKEYVMGGFNGGEAEYFLYMSEILARNIEEDERKGVRAEWFDESHLNYFISTLADRSKVKVLSPSYCLVEQKTLRAAWGISELEPKIIALSKDHNEIRN